MSVLTLNFAGYVQCRLATDPDPTDERRGVSGYTFALPGEPDLDWTLYTQPGPGVVARVGVERRVGVKVTGGFSGATAIVAGHPLFGAAVDLLDQPRFEERNYVVHSTTFGVIAPFKLRISGRGVKLFRQVDFYPGKPLTTPVFEVPQAVLTPYTMQSFEANAAACAALLGTAQNPSAYRQARLDTLLKIRARPRLTPEARAALDKRIDELRLDDPRDRRTAQLVNRAIFSYALNGPASTAFGPTAPAQWLNGQWENGAWKYHDPARPLLPWPCNFWIGSWDADSLTCYLQGTVKLYDLAPVWETRPPKGAGKSSQRVPKPRR